jgi:hypothetical protein
MAISLLPALALGGGAAAGGFLSRTKQSSAKIPVPVGSAMSHLLKLAKEAESARAPLRDILPMTDTEKKAYEGLDEYISAGPSGSFNIVKDILTKMVKTPSDISKLPGWEEAMADIEKRLGSQLSRTQRGMQRKGMAWSTPQGKALGRDFETARKNIVGTYLPYQLQLLGLKGDQLNQLLGLSEYEENAPLRKLGAVSTFNLPRTLDQKTADEKYNQIMNTLGLKYDTGGSLYSNLISGGSNLTTVKRPSGADPFTNAMMGATSMAQILPFLGLGPKTNMPNYGNARNY